MTSLPDTDRARPLLGKRGAFEGVARWPWMASEMGTDEAHTPTTNRFHHSAQRVVEKVGRSITNSETPHKTPPSDPSGRPYATDQLHIDHRLARCSRPLDPIDDLCKWGSAGGREHPRSSRQKQERG